jgi:hypothetical protein
MAWCASLWKRLAPGHASTLGPSWSLVFMGCTDALMRLTLRNARPAAKTVMPPTVTMKMTPTGPFAGLRVAASQEKKPPELCAVLAPS